MEKQAVKANLVKESTRLREMLKKSIKRSGHTYEMVVDRAKKDGHDISVSGLSRYISKGNAMYSISESGVRYLCRRYKIKIELLVKKK